MSGLQQLQRDFLAYLLSGDQRIAEHVVDQAPVSRDIRLHIYRNAYRVRLRETLDTDHQVLGLYLGDELFEQMVNGYIDAYPSPYRSLRFFADGLPDYLRVTAPFADHPQLAELAAFERRLLASFDAGDAERVELSALAALPPSDWPSLRLRFHPSVQLFRADWNSVEMWQALKAEEAPPVPAVQPDSWWLLWRGEDRLTEFRSVALAEVRSMQHFLHGGNFAGVCEQLLALAPADTVAGQALDLLGTWLASGLVIRLLVSDEQDRLPWQDQ